LQTASAASTIGRVAGAAAQISHQCVVDFVARRGAVALVIMGEQAHHDAGSAKAALRAVIAGHGFLHRMQHALVGQILDGD